MISRNVVIPALVAVLCCGFAIAVSAQAQEEVLPWKPNADDYAEAASHGWCVYPSRGPFQKDAAARQAALMRVQEVEPNSFVAQAQELSIIPEPRAGVDLDVLGRIGVPEPTGDPELDQGAADVDLYRFAARKGDVIGLAVRAEEPLDPIVAILDLSQNELIVNDDDGNQSGAHPASSPFPRGERLLDSFLTWVAPVEGEYLIRVSSFAEASSGDYTLAIRARRPGYEERPVPVQQVIFLDFDGATISTQSIFGRGFLVSNLSPLASFLSSWGLSLQDEAAVIDMIIETVEENFDDLRVGGLNGNRDVDNVDGNFDFLLLNSRDHADPWGQPNVSRVIVGGTVSEFGIPTIGIAESIDPGNFASEETAVVLLDSLSGPDGAPDSINSIPRTSNVTTVDAVGLIVGNIVSHEIGHYLGLWHTNYLNDIRCLIDQGGPFDLINIAGFGNDGVLGSGDDVDVDFVPDEYGQHFLIGPEDFVNAPVAEGIEPTDLRTAFALSTGRVATDTDDDLPDAPAPPLVSIQGGPREGDAPLTVDLSAGAVDNFSTFFEFTWDFGDESDLATGANVTHTYEAPGTYLVTAIATSNQGDTGQASIAIVVTGEGPDANFTADPTRGNAPLTVSFDASGSTAGDNAITDYTWDFGDGDTGTGITVEHTYDTPGTYAAKLTITADTGATGTTTRLITVTGSTSTAFESAEDRDVPIAMGCGAGMVGSLTGATMALLGLMLVRRK